MEQVVLETLRYFSFFSYPPTFEELHTFLKEKTSQRHLASILQRIEEKGVITRYGEKRYTLPQYSKNVTNYELRATSSEKKIERVRFYTKLLSFFPQIKLVGLSGSVAMMNAKEDDDVDLFIITEKSRLFTGRFIALFFAQLFGLRRKRDEGARHHKNKVCLNLFFDEADMRIPKFKQTEYVAHEVLQMKPLIQKDGIYMRFIDANRWVFDIFPNRESVLKVHKVYKVRKIQNQELSTFIFITFTLIERLFRSLQLFFINRHKTTEIITATQLWFFPDDFEKKLKGNSL